MPEGYMETSTSPVPINQIVLLDRMLLIGPPGIGKTEVVYEKAKQEAKMLNRKFVDIRKASEEELRDVVAHPERYYLYLRIIAPHVFPEDLSYPEKRSLNGLSYIRYIGPRELELFTLKDIEGVLFIDELNNVARSDQKSMYYSVIQEKEIAWHLKLSPGVKIIAAGNPPELSSIAGLLPAPLINRMTKVDVTIARVGDGQYASIDAWVAYMNRKYQDGWDKRVAAFLYAFPKYLYHAPKDPETLDNFPTPRSWTHLAVDLAKHLNGAPESMIRATIIGRVGPEAGAYFYQFVKKTPPPVDVILDNPTTLRGKELDELLMALYSVSQHPDKLLERGEKLLKFLVSENREAAMVLLKLVKDKVVRQIFIKYKDVTVELARSMKEYLAYVKREKY